MPRLYPPRSPVTVHFDGREVVAEEGEPAAVALIAAGHLALARSPKFHRPRGPYCLRGACDGCLARVDGIPNVMTCRIAAAPGMRIETQNVVGSGRTDLLRAADWLFPDGMNHHELLAGVPGVQRVLQTLARRVAGLGRLPVQASPPHSARRRQVDVLVVGAGPSGMSAALELRKRGRSVEVVDDDLSWGGSARALVSATTDPWGRLIEAFGDAIGASQVVMRSSTTAAGIYGDDLLVADAVGVELLNARTLVLAVGAHDGVLAFEGNDLPGILSARAGTWMAARGVRPGKRVVVVVAEGGGPFGEAFARTVPRAIVAHGLPLRAGGSARIRDVTVADGKAEQRLRCDVLLLDAPRAPAYELCAQAGAELTHEARGFIVKAPHGRIRRGVFALGEVVGTPLNPEKMAREAVAISEMASR